MRNSLLATVLLGLLALMIACSQDSPEFNVSSDVTSVDEAVDSFPEYVQEAVKGLTGNQRVTTIQVTGKDVPSAEKLASLVGSHLGETALASIETPNHTVIAIDSSSDNQFAQAVESAAKLTARIVAEAHGYNFYLKVGEDF